MDNSKHQVSDRDRTAPLPCFIFFFFKTLPVYHLSWCAIDQFWSFAGTVLTDKLHRQRTGLLGFCTHRTTHTQVQQGRIAGLLLLSDSEVTTPTYSLLDTEWKETTPNYLLTGWEFKPQTSQLWNKYTNHTTTRPCWYISKNYVTVQL